MSSRDAHVRGRAARDAQVQRLPAAGSAGVNARRRSANKMSDRANRAFSPQSQKVTAIFACAFMYIVRLIPHPLSTLIIPHPSSLKPYHCEDKMKDFSN